MATRVYSKTPFEGSSELRHFIKLLRAVKISCKSYPWVFGQCQRLKEPQPGEQDYHENKKIFDKEAEKTTKVEAILLSMIGTEPTQLIQSTLDNCDQQPCPRYRIRMAIQLLKDFYFQDLTQTVEDLKGEMHNLPVIYTFDRLEELVFKLLELHVELSELDVEHKARVGGTVSYSQTQITSMFLSKLAGENFRVSRDEITKDMKTSSERNEKNLLAIAAFYRQHGKHVSVAGNDSGDEDKEVGVVMVRVRTRLAGESRARKAEHFGPDHEVNDDTRRQLQEAWQQGYEAEPSMNSTEVSEMEQCRIRRQQRRQWRMNEYAQREREVLDTNKPDQDSMGMIKAAAIVRKNKATHSRSDASSSDQSMGAATVSVAMGDQGRGRSQEPQRMRSPSRGSSQHSQVEGGVTADRWEDRGRGEGGQGGWGGGGGAWGGGGSRPRWENKGRSPSAERERQSQSPSGEPWEMGGGRGDRGRGRGWGGERGDTRPPWEDSGRRRSPSAERSQHGHSPSGGGEKGAGGGGWGGGGGRGGAWGGGWGGGGGGAGGRGGWGGGGGEGFAKYGPASPTAGLCVQFTNSGTCNYGAACRFLHERQGGGGREKRTRGKSPPAGRED